MKSLANISSTTRLASHQLYSEKPFVGSSHSWAIKRCQELASDAAVLDIGAGSGFLGKTLRGAGISSLYAVEVDPTAKAHLSSIYKEVVDNIALLSEKQFDLIVLLDVLEHLPRPEEYFNALIPLLKPGGRIIVSVPNIAHWVVRFGLLFGNFNYTEKGLLDRTHLQFFTRSRFKALCANPKLELTQMGASIEPLELLLPQSIWDNQIFRIISSLRVCIARNLPGLFAYQHLAALKAK